MTFRSVSTFAVILFLFPIWCFAQKGSISFNHISTRDGLSQGNVICIIQDRHGFMWFGTRDGLNKYDGYRFTVYKNDPENPNTPAHNIIMDLEEDTLGHIWIGTGGGGLDRFDPATETFTHYQPKPGGLSGAYVNTLLIDKDQNVWAGTEGGGLNKLNPATGEFTHFRNDPSNSGSLASDLVRAMLIDSRGNFWVGTDGGLGLFSPDRKSFTHYRVQMDQDSTCSTSRPEISGTLNTILKSQQLPSTM
jgi:ligand-binding sensor domain-containing protein